MKKILILSFSDLSIDNRPIKQIRTLRESFHVTSVGKKPSGYEHEFIRYKKHSIIMEIFRLFLLLKKDYEGYYWTKYIKIILNRLKNEKYDLIIAHDEKTLPLAQKIANGAKIILDAHEYYPDVFIGSVLEGIYKKYMKYLFENLMGKPDAMLTVAKSIADKYDKEFNLKSEVILNLPFFREVKPTEINKDKVRIIHHGIAAPTRKIELMIEMMDYLDESYQLDLMLVSSRATYFYMRKLRKMAQKRKNVNIIEPVPYDYIIPKINQYDIGLFLIPPTNFSVEHTLPNKFFEFIQARLAIAVGPSPEMARIVKKYDIGVVANDFLPESLANEISSLSLDTIKLYKQRTDNIAREYAYEHEGLKLLNIVNTVMN